MAVNSNSPIHVGMIIGPSDSDPNKVKVWIPTLGSTAPKGRVQMVGQNSGSAMFGKQLASAKGTCRQCIISTATSGGTQFKYLPEKGAVVFDKNYKPGDNVPDFRITPNVTAKVLSAVQGNTTWRSSMPSQNLTYTAEIFDQIGGTPSPVYGNLPQGDFPVMEQNQWVLLACVNSKSTPHIINSVSPEMARSIIFG